MRSIVAQLPAMLLFLCLAALAHAKPPVFEDLTADQAVERATTESKFVVIDFTAEWCPPCKVMDRVTWANEGVAAWLREHTVPIQIDVDQDPASATRFGVRAMPTVVVLRDGEEIARAVGLKNAEQFLSWMTALKDGKPHAADPAPENRGFAFEVDDASAAMQNRMRAAQAADHSGRHEEALREYLWLWENVHKEAPAMSSVRLSFLASYIGELIKRHPPARAAFAAERDALTDGLLARPLSHDVVGDWITLNEMLGEGSRTLAFFDEVRDDPEAFGVLKGYAFRLTPLLITQGRWADAGALVNPTREIEHIKRLRQFEATQQRMPDMTDFELDRHATQYAALLAAGRDVDAEWFAERLLTLYPKPRVQAALIKRALKADQARPEHVRWLDEASVPQREAQRLREALNKALGMNS